MATQTVTLELPSAVYQQLKRRADADRQSVEQQLVSIAATAAPTLNDLPHNLEDLLVQLSVMDDEELWHAARAHVSADATQRAEELHTKRRRQGLTEVEAGELAKIMAHYERVMVLRAQAAATLKERGHDVTVILIKEP